MAELIVIRHPFASGNRRERYPLTIGASLASSLRTLFADGIPGPWKLYRGEVHPECYLPIASHVNAIDDDTYVLVIQPAGPVFPLVFQIMMSFALSSLAMALSMRHRREEVNPDQDEQSPNNIIAGQRNMLRPGARVPDILGKVRAYPDLLAPPIETWNRRIQNIEQWFVLGVGAYLVEAEKLGETSLAAIGSGHCFVYAPGDDVPQIRAVKTSPEINSMSLMTEEGVSVGLAGVSFDVAGTMSTPSAIPSAAVGNLLQIQNTASNDGFFKITSVPSSGPPYVYGLDGTHVTESGVDLIYSHWNNPYTLHRATTLQNDRVRASDAGAPPPSGGLGALNGFAVELITPSSGSYRGIIRGLSTIALGPPNIQEFSLEDVNGAFYEWGATAINAGMSTYNLWYPAGSTPSGGSLLMTPGATAWFRVPLDDPDAVLIDISFPEGIVLYDTGARTSYSVAIKIEFRRPGAFDPQVTDLPDAFVDETTGLMRFTLQYLMSDLLADGLPAGTGLEVRCTRLTVIPMDSATKQYISDTRWESLRAVKLVPKLHYDATLLQLTMTNSRSAVSLGQNSFNVIATRKLPTWDGSTWSTAAPTEKWADALVERMKSSSGARKLDAQIDLAGIYAVQATLDAMDGGDQGKISMTLDRSQDIDTELQLIAQIARAHVYRIGTKLFVSRDEGGKTPVALFTARSKHPDGETVEFNLQNSGDPDSVTVQWFDRAHGWKLREFQYGEDTPLNPLRIAPAFATWAQAWRRAVFEWNRITLRRDSLHLNATEEALLIHPGDVINVVDDCANLAQSAGEVLAINALVLTLDVPVALTGALSIMLRDQHGRSTDLIDCTPGPQPHDVTLARAPAFPVKGRDDSTGSIYALYLASAANVRPWLVQSLEPDVMYAAITATNWREDVYAGDTATLPPVPPLLGSSP